MALRPAQVLAALGLSLTLLGCVRVIPQGAVAPPQPPITATAMTTGLSAGPSIDSLKLGGKDARGALSAFKESCPRLIARSDASGLTQGSDWKPACDAASKWPLDKAPQFFADWFETVRVGDGKAFSTGYYEPEIAGVKTRRPGFDTPVYGMPSDLVRAKAGEAAPNAKGDLPLGRYDAGGKFVPYYDRAAIEDGALSGRGLEIAWVADPVELFFLHVQGSGRLIAPDGSVIRIGYTGQNGHPYTGIGTVMRQRGYVGPGTPYATSMQGLMEYMRANPDNGRAIMRENKSYIFFKDHGTAGPFGTIGVTVRARDSIAADPAFVPLGAPVWLELDRPEANGLWIAQDTGGAIKGANRFDTFWGAGDQARITAGGMTGRGEALIFLPKGTLKKLQPAQ